MRRAEKKLAHVVEICQAALPVACHVEKRESLMWALVFDEGFEVEEVDFSYSINSKVFATLFDLHCAFVVDAAVEFKDGAEHDASSETRIWLDPKRDAFVCNDDSLDVSVLADAAIKDRVMALGVTSANAQWSSPCRRWDVDISSLVGSSTWNLIPPILHLIEPSKDECRQMLELVRMLAAFLRENV